MTAEKLMEYVESADFTMIEELRSELESTKQALASALAEVEKLKAEKKELQEGIADAIQHLNYIGWGRDTWERKMGEETRKLLNKLEDKYPL